MLYFLNCKIDRDRLHLREGLKKSHLGHAIQHRQQIVYAGIVETEAAGLEQVCYFLNASSLEEARAFAAADPYQALYASVEVREFKQRLPEPSAGLLERIFNSLPDDPPVASQQLAG